MLTRNTASVPRLLVLPLALSGALLLPLLSASSGHGAASALTGHWISADDLGGASRYLAHVATDKPMYREGESVYVRTVVLAAADQKPFPNTTWGTIEILGPKGETVSSGQATLEDSVAGFKWEVPAGQAGGQYKVRVTFTHLGIPPAERSFDVRAYRAPRLKTQIKFVRDGYGPGDEVAASVEVSRAEGGIPTGARVEVSARVDGVEVYRGPAQVGPDGMAMTRFRLPDAIARGDGTLSFAIQDGGNSETASKTIPILLQTVDLSFYPEGGDLVAGLVNRVYLQALTPSGKPADLTGEILDSSGKSVGTFRSEHEGRGRFSFSPQRGQSYALRVSSPAGIRRTFPLPQVKDSGVVLRSTREVFGASSPVELEVMANPLRNDLVVTLARRERAMGEVRPSSVGSSPTAVRFPASPDQDGVLVATVWDKNGHPLAERLVFRQPDQQVKVAIDPDRTRTIPGGKVSLTLKATDEAGKPVSAMVGVTVTDDSVLELIDKREQAPRLPVMVYLEEEVQDLADAQLYLNPEDSKAPIATDLLLGVQGWRRFAFVSAEKFLTEFGDDARRVLALRTATVSEEAIEATVATLDGAGMGLARANGRPVHRVRLEEHAPMMVPPAPVPAPPEPDAAVPEGDVPAREPVADVAAQDNRRQLASGVAPPPPVEQRARQEMVAALEKSQAKKKADERFFDRDAEDELFEDSSLIPVREYAHRVRPDRRPNDRSDFTETLFWNAGVRTDGKKGEATVTFDLSDAVSSFRVFADAFDGRGAVGTSSRLIESVQPFYVEAKLPLEVTEGDRVQAPLTVVNATFDRLAGALEVSGLSGWKVGAPGSLELGADQRVRRLLSLEAAAGARSSELVVQATAGDYSDRVTRPLKVVPRGFPARIDQGGMLEPDGTLSFEVKIPATRVPGSLSTELKVYPSPLANLTQALERLIQEPYGCFEQTSSTTYPLVMAQQYFTTHQGVDPALIARSSALLEKGYNRLIGFETPKQGYEWFGEAPAHEALSAYGLTEFYDMAKVRPVDSEMLSRTRAWVLAARDGKGGFKRERRALHSWIEDRDSSDAYITWSLLESGEEASSLKKEIDSVLERAVASKNSYVVALGANVAFASGRKDLGSKLGERLIGLQGKTGAVSGATISIVGSSGEALEIETTSLAALAWMNDPRTTGSVEKAIRYLADSAQGGRYGSTQSTVLALKAIVTYDQLRARPKVPGNLELRVDGQPVGEPVRFDENTQGVVSLADFSAVLTPGKHRLELRMQDGSEMPASLTIRYSDETPASSPETKVQLAVRLADAQVVEGRVTEALVRIENRAREAVPNPVAIVGIPGGLEVRHDQLKELVKQGRIAAYEVIAREVVLYWRDLGAGQVVELPLSLVAAIPGRYTGPSSRTYLYYGDEHKHWIAPLVVEISPRDGT